MLSHSPLARLSVIFAGASVFVACSVACNTTRPAPAGSLSGGSTVEPAPGTVSVSPGSGAGSAASSDAAPDEDGGMSKGDGGDASMGQPVDASIRTPSGNDDLCDVSPTGWWATESSLDAAITPSDFASALNALFARPNAHPLAIAIYTDDAPSPTWRFKATGALTNGIGQQYFPFDHPTTAVGAARTRTSVGSAEHETSAFLHVVDGASQDVWLPIDNVDTHATIADSYCAHLGDGVLTATIDHSAGVITMTLADGSVTPLAGLLGAETGSGGWPLRLTFTAEKVQISLK